MIEQCLSKRDEPRIGVPGPSLIDFFYEDHVSIFVWESHFESWVELLGHFERSLWSIIGSTHGICHHKHGPTYVRHKFAHPS